jgi:hypothetical protein
VQQELRALEEAKAAQLKQALQEKEAEFKKVGTT